MPETEDDLYMGYSEPGSGSGQFTLLPPGQHAVTIASINRVAGKFPNQKTGVIEEQFKITFEALTRKDEKGNPMVITLWTGLNYGHEKAKLTHLVDQIFGRPLTKSEAPRIRLKSLVGLKGYALVTPVVNADGSSAVKFGSWLAPENRPLPDVSAHLRAEESPMSRPAQTPTPKAVTEEGDIPDPFE